jgi:two-component system, NarL family, nitrate/nitrite response regulator NarL
MKRSCLSILVADDHPVVLRGIVDVLRTCSDMKVIAECRDGKSAIDTIRTLEPDIAVLDIAMPGLSGLDVLASIRAEQRKTKIVFLTASIADEQILAAIADGVKAMMLKDTVPENLIECVRTVAAGGKWLPTDMVDAAVERLAKRQLHVARLNAMLTARERDVMLLVAQGHPNKEVARRLAVTEGTIKIHLHNIYKKIGVANRTALAAFAIAHIEELRGQ